MVQHVLLAPPGGVWKSAHEERCVRPDPGRLRPSGVTVRDSGSQPMFFFQAEDGIRDYKVTRVQTCALPICEFELYHRLLDEIHQRKLNANVSLKLTHMGFDVSEDLAFGLVTELVDHAVRINNFIRVDMEGSPYTQRALEFVRGLHREPGHAGRVGTVIQ